MTKSEQIIATGRKIIAKAKGSRNLQMIQLAAEYEILLGEYEILNRQALKLEALVHEEAKA